MKIDRIILENFRQYFGENSIELDTNDPRNIILIGGKNGYGKTNFLLSLVWCLYGEDIGKIDESYRKEIQKDGNYARFLKNSLNWDCLKNGQGKFSVEIWFSEIELPETIATIGVASNKCKVRREFDASILSDDLQISVDGLSGYLFEEQADKINFINDYLIPLEAAKFVFFDAEKIASWAELSTREEGSILNDALGKVLGLDIYESLIDDLRVYTDALRKDSANAQVKQQIISTENGIDLNIEKIEELEKEILNQDTEIKRIKEEIVKYESFLSAHGRNAVNTIDLAGLYKERTELKLRQRLLENKFNEVAELLPFAISAGKLAATVDYLKLQEQHSSVRENATATIQMSIEIIEKLFNLPPFPADGDIPFSKKIFYAEKAKTVIEKILGSNNSSEELDFEHDLSKSEKDFLFETYDHIRRQSKDLFEQTIEDFNQVKEKSIELEKQIKKIESDQEDEEIMEYNYKKNDLQRRLEKFIEEKGALQNIREGLKKDNEKMSQSLHILLKKVSVSEQKRKKLDKANSYIKTLEDFVIEQKKSKCVVLETVVFGQMKKLMHKLSATNYQDFIAEVKAETLPENDGLKITLYNKEGRIRAKESLSQGEKQLYISSLIKAILSLSIQEYPIFIDTPLGRLDDLHIKQVLLYYYPELAKQVILMATNNEIPPSRYKLMQENVARTYILESSNNRTQIKDGYFKSYEN